MTLAFIGTVWRPAVQLEKWKRQLIARSHASMFTAHHPDRMTMTVTLALSSLVSSSATWGLALESAASVWPLLRLRLRPLDHQHPQRSRWYTHFLQGSEARIKDALVLSMDPD